MGTPRNTVSTAVRFVMLALGIAVSLPLWLGSVLPSSSAADEAEKPAPGSQRHYLELSRAEHNTRITWQPQTSFTFDDPAVLDTLRVTEGKWEVRDGQLQVVDGEPDHYRTILVAHCPAGPMRVAFDATLFPRPDGRIGDIYIRLNADDAGSSARGYGLFAGHYFNQASVCYKLNQPIARTEWSPLVPGQRHHVVAEWTHPTHLRLFVDGRIVLDAWDRSTTPIAPDPAKWIGLAVYDTRIAIDNLTISTPAPK